MSCPEETLNERNLMLKLSSKDAIWTVSDIQI